MNQQKWPPPEFPLVNGEYALTKEWLLHLPEQFARRIEDGSHVLWRPGLTFWLAAWNNDRGESQSQRLVHAKQTCSPSRFDERESITVNTTQFSYRLRDENNDGCIESIYSLVFSVSSELQMAAYFDHAKDESVAWNIIDSVVSRNYS